MSAQGRSRHLAFRRKPDVRGWQVTRIGDDSEFDPGIGVCGKAGRGVPVGVGQPSLKLTGLTVGGTAV
jgi:hypothetical protein